uniref:NAD-dependent epimerase/dehydratase domain-containing protein n=1 Tax=viral metagenome TaxID=1070528 RepID=A0A6C0JYE3_9ZZZZ
MKILVTGGGGFIGSNLVDCLIAKNYDVVVVDNLSSAYVSKSNFNSDAKYVFCDIADYKSTRKLYDGVSYVYHLAAESRIQPSINNPLLAVKTNTMGTATVLQCAREANVERVVYSSTSAVYGLKNKLPSNENMIDDCLNPYSVSKLSGEKLCQMYSRLFGVDTVIFRYFNVYGNREPISGQYASVIGIFLNQLKKGMSLTIVGDGKQRRDFVNVNDIVHANILAMDSKIKSFGEIYNVGTGVNYSVKELADMISTNQIHVESRPGEATETLADTTKLERVFNWKPTIQLTDYIDSTKELT